VLYERFKSTSEREQLYRTMPTEFKKFGKCIVITDCFEVFMERPSSLKAREQTWSNYKHHNTCTLLIGIAPQGSISFVPQARGGRVSDLYLTEHCGILNKWRSYTVVSRKRAQYQISAHPPLLLQFPAKV